MHSPAIFRNQTQRRLLIGCLLFLSVVAFAFLSARLNAANEPFVPDAPGSGTLMLTGKNITDTVPAVRLGTDMDVTVTGQIARVRVTQAFRNTSNAWMRASYLYPLPDNGAVDSLKMVVGNRVIVGEIKRREEAQQIFEKAAAEGKKAGLVEQKRPNMFRTKVANVGPGQTVLISIEYQAPVAQSSGEYALRLPLVVAPRYVPPHSLTKADSVTMDGAALADAVSATAPLMKPYTDHNLNPVSITVHLKPGFAPANLISSYHRIAIAKESETSRTISLADGTVPANRDFELRWRPASADPVLGVFREQARGENYVMVSLTPPADDVPLPANPREMVFVIDNSGSMGGESMREARDSLLHALDTLQPQDRFNIIRFDDSLTELFVQPVEASPEQLAIARRFTNGLEADGGTEMLPALKAALVDHGASSSGMVRQVIFLTDGSISNETEMMAELGRNAGRSRIFMVGIGSAPNNFLMTRMAEIGRGSYTNIGDPEEVNASMTALLDKLRKPAVTDLAVTTDGGALDLLPAQLPDLYAGEPLVLVGRGNSLAGSLNVTGRIGGKPWQQTVKLADAITSPSVAKLWARRKVEDAELAVALGTIEYEEASDRIANIGLAYSLVTRETSLVAVESERSRPADAPLLREELPLSLPAGWDFDSLFGQQSAGEMGQTASNGADADNPAEPIGLPQTATGFAGDLQKGGLLLLIGLLGLLALRSRTVRGVKVAC